MSQIVTAQFTNLAIAVVGLRMPHVLARANCVKCMRCELPRGSIMWMLYARAPTPDVPVWPGRKWLALLDALAWPCLVAFIVVRSPLATGVAGPVVVALCILFALRRGVRALWRNEQYRFSTWSLGVPLATLLALGALLKVAA